MKIRCIASAGQSLSEKSLKAGYLSSASFPMKIGTIFNVYGICLWNDVLSYLLMDPESSISYPEWFPAELFIVEDGSFPLDWYYRYLTEIESLPLRAIWGYKELTDFGMHFDQLMEHETNAMKVFLRRKREIDDYYG